MAEVTGLRNNALPYPVYAAPWAVVFGIRDSAGDLVTGAAGLDSEVSLNGDTFADCTNEATEIGSTGMYYLLLTAAECTADVVAGQVKTSTVGAKTTPFALYPRKLPQLRANTAAGGAVGYITLDAAASALDDRYNGMICIATIDSNVEARVISDYDGTTKQASVVPNWNVAPDSDDTFIMRLPDGIQRPAVDVIAISGDTTAADNLEAGFDGAGYAGGTIKQDVNVVQVGGSATAATGVQTLGNQYNTFEYVSADVIKIAGDTTAATNLYGRLTALGSGQVQLLSALTSASTLSIYQGDSYYGTKTQTLTWVVPLAMADLTGATVLFKLALAAGTFSRTGTVTNAGVDGSQIVSIALSAADTAAWAAQTGIKFELQATWAATSEERTLVVGTATITAQIA